MRTGYSGNLIRAAHSIDDGLCRFHGCGTVAILETLSRVNVAKTEKDLQRYSQYHFHMLANWLQAALKTSGISQSELSRRLTEMLGRSIDRAAINKMCSGTRNIYGDELLAIVSVTGVAAPQLFEDATTEPNLFPENVIFDAVETIFSTIPIKRFSNYSPKNMAELVTVSCKVVAKHPGQAETLATVISFHDERIKRGMANDKRSPGTAAKGAAAR